MLHITLKGQADLQIRYNQLPYIGDQPPIPTEHVMAILSIFTAYSKGDTCGIHLIHRHREIPAGTIRLETKFSDSPGTWSKAVPIKGLDIANIHPTEYKLKDGKFTGYTFAEGPSPNTFTEADLDMFNEVIDYLQKHKLTELVAVQIGHFDAGLEKTTELEVVGLNAVDLGTVTLPGSMVNAEKTVPTGYNATLLINQPDKPPAGQAWAETIKATHRVFINKPAGVGPGELMDALRAINAVKAA